MDILKCFGAMLALRNALEQAHASENAQWHAPGRLDNASPAAATIRLAGKELNKWGGTNAMIYAAKALVIEDPVRYVGLRSVLDGLWSDIGSWRPLAG